MSVYPTDIIKQLFFSFLRFLVGTFVTNGLFHEYNDKLIITFVLFKYNLLKRFIRINGLFC